MPKGYKNSGTKRSVSVIPRDNSSQSLERALRELKRKLKKDDFYKEMREESILFPPLNLKNSRKDVKRPLMVAICVINTN